MSRALIRKHIDERGACRVAAITRFSGNVAIFGDNFYSAVNCPQELIDKLQELNGKVLGLTITENGLWALHTTKGFSGRFPMEFDDAIRDIYSRGKLITASFNDKGEWIAIGDSVCWFSNERIHDFVVQAMEEYGPAKCVSMTNYGTAIVCDRGWAFSGKVPDELLDEIPHFNIKVEYVAISSDGAYFVADSKGNNHYYM